MFSRIGRFLNRLMLKPDVLKLIGVGCLSQSEVFKFSRVGVAGLIINTLVGLRNTKPASEAGAADLRANMGSRRSDKKDQTKGQLIRFKKELEERECARKRAR